MQPQNPRERDNANERYIDLQALQPSRDVSLTLGANRHARERTDDTSSLCYNSRSGASRGLGVCVDYTPHLWVTRSAVTRAPGHQRLPINGFRVPLRLEKLRRDALKHVAER